MFGSIGGPELILIFLVALLIFGPRKLPELGKTLGKSLGEFRRAANDLRVSLETEVAREASAKALPPAPASASGGEPAEGSSATAPGPAAPSQETPATPGGPIVPAPAPGTVTRPRLVAPGLPEPDEAAPATPAPAAPEADGRELEGPR